MNGLTRKLKQIFLKPTWKQMKMKTLWDEMEPLCDEIKTFVRQQKQSEEKSMLQFEPHSRSKKDPKYTT